eukprot:TRINITY_DN61633_c0_g1_i1.p1 TRINITY_DN61633_c0_g1~~TRINITY_DN61633_c0_g1_i1.p1  ORF type:complete len:299 (+),score=65.04 TRINITY_DN61633_c0_g1_i1:74-898(+)
MSLPAPSAGEPLTEEHARELARRIVGLAGVQPAAESEAEAEAVALGLLAAHLLGAGQQAERPQSLRGEDAVWDAACLQRRAWGAPLPAATPAGPPARPPPAVVAEDASIWAAPSPPSSREPTPATRSEARRVPAAESGPLPQGWRAYALSGRHYYVHNSGVRQWRRPEAAPSASDSPAVSVAKPAVAPQQGLTVRLKVSRRGGASPAPQQRDEAPKSPERDRRVEPLSPCSSLGFFSCAGEPPPLRPLSPVGAAAPGVGRSAREPRSQGDGDAA